ncbi:MAG TPA: putative toxin-antitoxin system toxin component, PIN family [Smithellaceae bacterium]|nr:putative toxin-antitoxin system toxin component, PIN family [Smithellaceae bacterium]HRS90176.1 putative toxin-antitoxin system toxin component, PIN family [Smithellaceae bacterium]HRV27143.1 putative toxin-antitoxin system toxin component, PIN family [Smithellaceae bacterium]
MKTVFDTNVLIAAFLTEGVCSGLLTRARKRYFNLILCDDIIREFKKVLKNKFKLPSSDISEITNIVEEAAAEIIHKPDPIKSICRDPSDDFIISCAVAAEAHYIVTGDEDLLILKRYKEINIINPRNFEALFTV